VFGGFENAPVQPDPRGRSRSRRVGRVHVRRDVSLSPPMRSAPVPDSSDEDDPLSSSDSDSGDDSEPEGERDERMGEAEGVAAEAASWHPIPDLVWAALCDIGAVFSIFQLESCPETGRRHLQGYVRLRSPQRISALQRALPGGHFEAAAAKESKNIEYCSKEESRVDGPW